MYAHSLRCILAATMLAVTAPLVAQEREKPVTVYVDHLPKNTAEQVRKHAAQGETALRRYLAGTSGTQPLRWEDVTMPKAQPVSDPGSLSREPKKHANQYR